MADVCDRAFAELTAGEWHDIARLRVDVFVVEQECIYAEFDGRDVEPATRHVWIAGDAQGELPVTAYARTLAEPDGATRIGRVVTHARCRSAGLAGLLVDHIMGNSKGPWVLDAQSQLVDWYLARGFIETGDEFREDGIPHVPMRRGPAATDA